MHKQAGMSIMEIMVAMGLLGILSLGAMELMKNMNKSALSGELAVDVNQAYSEIQKIMSNPSHCTGNLEGRTVYPGQEISIEALYLKDNNGNSAPFYVAGDPKYKIGKIYIKQIGLAYDRETEDGAMLKLNVIFSKDLPNSKREFFGGKEIKKELSVHVDNCYREALSGNEAEIDYACRTTYKGKLGEMISDECYDPSNPPNCVTRNCVQCATMPRDEILKCN